VIYSTSQLGKELQTQFQPGSSTTSTLLSTITGAETVETIDENLVHTQGLHLNELP
jgi:hypothetical protein